jgi:nanoRNase/pAp phosphatase (c-di-AMP/oligoRNAs hydrolase)
MLTLAEEPTAVPHASPAKIAAQYPPLLFGSESSAMSKSDQLLLALSDYDRFTIVMHDNPDPDAISSGWGISKLIETKLRRPVELIGGGAIVRAENRHMVELLSPPIKLVDEIRIDEGAAVLLVDCGPRSTNNLVSRHAIHPVAVIDHHLDSERSIDLAFADSRPDVAATATIAAEYLQEQGIEPSDTLATAMLYAIRTETRGFETRHTELDRKMVLWLTERSDPTLLAEIESAPLSFEYFSDLVLALESTVVFGDAALCLLPRAEGAEIVGELADLLVRCRRIRRVLSGAVVNGDLLVSVRTEREGDNAARLVQKLLEGLGSGGGHDHRAGGKVPNVGGTRVDKKLKNELRRRWLDACGIDESTKVPLIRRRDLLKNL